MGKTTKSVILLTGLLAVFLLPACKEKPKNPVAEYGDAMMGAYKGAQNTADLATLEGVKKGVQAYRAANGSYPAELKDIGDLMGGQVDFSKFDYDPATGTVTPKPQK
jgi:hypothetical protein